MTRAFGVTFTQVLGLTEFSMSALMVRLSTGPNQAGGQDIMLKKKLGLFDLWLDFLELS